jgi:hypothetical protein
MTQPNVKPYTPDHYDCVFDADYPALDKAVETHRDADVDALCVDHIEDVMTAEDWSRDCSDYLIESTETLRQLLAEILLKDAPTPFEKYFIDNFEGSGFNINNLVQLDTSGLDESLALLEKIL